MTVSKAKLEANKRYMEKLDVIKLQPKKELGQAIRSHAAQAGESVSGYILSAVETRMKREDENEGV